MKRAAEFVHALDSSARGPAIAAAPDGSVEFEWEPVGPRPAIAVTLEPSGRIVSAAFTAAAIVAEQESDDPVAAAQFVISFLDGAPAGAR